MKVKDKERRAIWPRGIAVAVGLNTVDPEYYQGWSGDLNGCAKRRERYAGYCPGRWLQSDLASDKRRDPECRAVGAHQLNVTGRMDINGALE